MSSSCSIEDDNTLSFKKRIQSVISNRYGRMWVITVPLRNIIKCYSIGQIERNLID